MIEAKQAYQGSMTVVSGLAHGRLRKTGHHPLEPTATVPK